MGSIITDGFYNGEVNYYTYYDGEPDTSTLHFWGHFSQIVWKDTESVGCYTTDCSASGLGNIDPSSGIRPFFTVCNYGPPGKLTFDGSVKPVLTSCAKATGSTSLRRMSLSPSTSKRLVLIMNARLQITVKMAADRTEMMRRESRA